MIPFGTFFDKVKLIVDKRMNSNIEPLEWSSSELKGWFYYHYYYNLCDYYYRLDGHKADCFRFKLYTDKPLAIKLILHRAENSSSKKRVELSDQLRAVLPNMAIDPTEDEVLLAMWEYIDSHNLIDSKGVIIVIIIIIIIIVKIILGSIKCDAEKDKTFLALVRQESFPFTTLKQKLIPHLLQCKPIQVDYNATFPTNSSSSAITAPSITKPRTFDIEVDIPDPYPFEILNTLNHIGNNITNFTNNTYYHHHVVLKQREMEGRQVDLYLMADYISRTIGIILNFYHHSLNYYHYSVKQKQVVDDLHCIVEDPLTYSTTKNDKEKSVVVHNSKAPKSSTISSSDGRSMLTLDFSVGEMLGNSIDPVLLLDRIGIIIISISINNK